MAAIGDSGDEPVFALLLLNEKECTLRASRSRLCFENYHEQSQENLTQVLTLTLESGYERHAEDANTSLNEEVCIPIIISPPATSRFELRSSELATSPSLLKSLLNVDSLRTYAVRFKPPVASESDYAWDNFQDQVVIHTRLCKLVIRLEAWKSEAPPAREHEKNSSLLFPVSMPKVKTLPLKSFTMIKPQAKLLTATSGPRPRHTICASLLASDGNNTLDTMNPRIESLPPLPRPSSIERQSSPHVLPQVNAAASSTEHVAPLPRPSFTEVQSQREAREVIMRLRCRRTSQSSTNVEGDAVNILTSTDKDLFPETVALDARTKADLEAFNCIVVAAQDQVAKETGKAKSELAYYQKFLPVPPGDSSSNSPTAARGSSFATCKSKKPRHLSAAFKRPSKLPSLSRPSSSTSASSVLKAAESNGLVNNQEALVAEVFNQPTSRQKLPARQRVLRTAKLQSLPISLDKSQHVQQQKYEQKPNKMPLRTKIISRCVENNQRKQQPDLEAALSDFDDPDPVVDEAPILPDDLAGVATLEDDDMQTNK